ncbi:hypothetical protein ABIB66_007605 [Bradyrhizobium sp. F1.13.3]
MGGHGDKGDTERGTRTASTRSGWPVMRSANATTVVLTLIFVLILVIARYARARWGARRGRMDLGLEKKSEDGCV